MSRGGMPRAEFVQGVQINRGRRRLDNTETRLTPTCPELRVIRSVDVVQSDADTWHAFLDDLGRSNYGKGSAYSLGSVAVTLLMAKESGPMLEEKFGSLYRSQGRTRDVPRKVAAGIRDFIRDSFANSYTAQTLELEAAGQFRLRRALKSFDMSNELEDMPAADTLLADKAVDPLPVGEVTQPYFGDATFDVRGLDLYGKEGFGLDLTHNDQLRHERQALLGYLKHDEGLNVSRINHGWQPHATVFKFSEHINAASITYQNDVPPEIACEPPRPIVT